MDLTGMFGGIDIYLFDQFLRGRITPRDVVVDAGCGFGRNLVYPLRAGCRVYGIDHDPDAIVETRALAAALAPALPADHFRVESIQQSTLPDELASVVLSSAVLHFANDDDQFDAMLEGTWRLLASRGLFFCRLASSIGIEARVQPIAGRRCRLPDGTSRYLVDEPLLVERTRTLGGRLLDPLKTTIVQDQRAMTTWVMRKD
jgi:SAM-dependent methyltransferase